MRKVLFLTTLLAFVMTSSLWAADLSGTWTIKMKSPQGQDESFDLVVKDTAGKLEITGPHPQLQALAGDGTVKGDAVTMDVKATGQMAVELVFTGKLAGNKIAGTREIKMSGGGAPGGGSSGASAASGAPEGAPAGGQGGAPGGQAPAGGQGGAPGGQGGQAPAGGQQGGQGGAPAMGGQGGAPGGQGGAPGGAAGGEVSNAFTAEKK
jgi:hypothetical protein